jgi:hypothetical protein
LKRLDSITRSPVYAHFSQTLNGLSSIRAYRAQEVVSLENTIKLDNTIRMDLAMFSSNRWLSIRLELLGGIMVLSTSLIISMNKSSFPAAVVGLVLGYSLQVTSIMNRNVRLGTMAENSFNSV